MLKEWKLCAYADFVVLNILLPMEIIVTGDGINPMELAWELLFGSRKIAFVPTPLFKAFEDPDGARVRRDFVGSIIVRGKRRLRIPLSQHPCHPRGHIVRKPAFALGL